MGESPDRPVGERRRRREAERAAALAAESTGATRPLTRRELRWQQAEEAARLEAIATGELPLAELRERVTPATSATTGAAASTPDESAGTSPADGPAGTAPSARSAGSAGSAPSATTAPATAPSGATAAGVPSRRSLRERAEEPGPEPAERAQERTATGRRPVVRTPSTAQGVRSLDTTGRLTGIQPVVRPDATDLPTPSPAPTGRDGRPAGTPAGASVAARAEGGGPRDAERTEVPTSESPEDDDAFDMHPEWLAVSSISGATPDDAKSALPARRTRRAGAPADPTPAEPEPERGNPAVAAIKVAVLVLVALVIGTLIWLLGTEAFAEDPAGVAHPILSITAPHPEETRAR